MLDGLTRAQAARLLHVCACTVSAAFPVTDRDRLNAGQAVQIGGIWAKRCNVCRTTKELDRFTIRSERVSGHESTCNDCKRKAK